MQNCWNFDLKRKWRQLTGPVNYRDFRETGPRAIAQHQFFKDQLRHISICFLSYQTQCKHQTSPMIKWILNKLQRHFKFNHVFQCMSSSDRHTESEPFNNWPAARKDYGSKIVNFDNAHVHLISNTGSNLALELLVWINREFLDNATNAIL